MKAGDEIVVKGKTYVAADMQLLRTMMGFRSDEMRQVCNYCTDACKIERWECIRSECRNELAKTDSFARISLCNEESPQLYFFLKPEQPTTGE